MGSGANVGPWSRNTKTTVLTVCKPRRQRDREPEAKPKNRWLILGAVCGLVTGCVDVESDIDPEFVQDNVPAEPNGIPLPKGGGKLESRGYFSSKLIPLLTRDRPKGSCVSCHQGFRGPIFLGEERRDHYNAIVMSPVVGKTSSESSLYTIGAHTGDGFCNDAEIPSPDCEIDEREIVRQWLLFELGI